MDQRLPEEVIQYLLSNPPEVERIQRTIAALAKLETWHAEQRERRKNAPSVPCGIYGCTEPKNAMDAMCNSCREDYREDPDAYK